MTNAFSINTSDDQLVCGCKTKNRLAQRYLYEKHFSPLMLRALRYTKNDREQALDILNRSFLKIFNSLENFKDENLVAWMAKIVTNTAIDSLRTHTTYTENIVLEEQTTLEKSKSFAEPEVIDWLNLNDLWTIINELSTATRTVFIMQAIDGYKQTEIADLLHISEGTVKWHFSNARKQLQQRIK